jgi:DNA ligase-1
VGGEGIMQEPITRPMLSAKFDNFEQEKHNLKFPLLATPKLDGIRCVKVYGKALSRTFKPIPNKYVREKIEAEIPDNTDMELVSGSFNST